MDGWCVLVLLIASVCFTLGAVPAASLGLNLSLVVLSTAPPSFEIEPVAGSYYCIIFDGNFEGLPCAPVSGFVKVNASPTSAWVTFDPVMFESVQGKFSYKIYFTSLQVLVLKYFECMNPPCKLYDLDPSTYYQLQVVVANSSNQNVAQSSAIRFSTPEGRKYSHHCFNKEEELPELDIASGEVDDYGIIIQTLKHRSSSWISLELDPPILDISPVDVIEFDTTSLDIASGDAENKGKSGTIN